jgi:hypothetical protein
MLCPTGRDPIAVIPNGSLDDFRVGKSARINGIEYEILKVIDMGRIGAPYPWIGLGVRKMGDKG